MVLVVLVDVKEFIQILGHSKITFWHFIDTRMLSVTLLPSTPALLRMVLVMMRPKSKHLLKQLMTIMKPLCRLQNVLVQLIVSKDGTQQLLICLKEEHMLTQAAMMGIVEGVTRLAQQQLETLKSKVFVCISCLYNYNYNNNIHAIYFYAIIH